MKIDVSPANGRIVPCSAAALSTSRSEVVPTATIRPPALRAALSASAVAAPIGYNLDGDRDAVFVRVGDALAAVPGVQIANKAQILGTYDVDYMGAKFLVRVTKVGDGAYVSAVDPRGLPPTGEAPVKLIGALKAAIAP